MRHYKAALVVAGIHLTLFGATVAYIYNSSDNQAALVWLLWMIPDVPVSLLHLVGPAFTAWLHSVVGRDTLLDYALYPPYVIHGVLGTLWWYGVTRFISAKRYRRRLRRDGSVSST